ncbi:MAG TPA: class I SAM-dependent methyltransferase [Polyangiaceae bacterium]|nr:class I SAM-dependent methyltransferase [Polyangiaceae bacterium]
MQSLFVPFRAERILARRDGILVVDKPPGLVVHGGDEKLGGDLVTRLSALLKADGHDGYLGVHSRLDLGTSGVLPFTTERDVNARVAAEIEAGRSERVYVAAVSLGRRARLTGSGTLEHRLESDKRRARVVTTGGDFALAHYRVLSEQGGRALVELRPETGRMHQLRVQLTACDAAIAGDELYGGAAAWRLLLHCRSRSVLGERFEAAVPDELLRWVQTGSSFASLAAFRPRLLDAAVRRAPLCESGDVFRVVNDQGDGLPGITLDRYGDFAVLALSSAEAEEQALQIGQCLLEHGVRGVYVKRRERRDLRRAEAPELAPATPLTGEPAPVPLGVREGALTILTELGDGLSTGLFIDQRDNRLRVRELSRDKQVLNLFSYTCSFSVAAALGGASRVTSVDLSGRALERGKANFTANGLAAQRHEFVQSDAVRFVRGAVKHGRRFDVIVLDPPSFATVGRATFRFERDITGLMADCLRLLGPEGTLFCVTNHKKTSLAQFRRCLQNAATEARRELKIKDLPSGLDCPEALDGPHPSKSLLGQAVVSSKRT